MTRTRFLSGRRSASRSTRRTRRCIAWLAAGTLAAASAFPAVAADLIHFWDEPRYGANSFNRTPPGKEYFEALAATGATWVRLTFSKWDGAGRDFLIGNIDEYDGLVEADLTVLIQALDHAHAAGLRVVVVPLGLPGARWQQQNNGELDDRLWSDTDFWEQAADFWSDLAGRLAVHPAIAAYNIINEPAPERTAGLPENAALETNREFVREQSGTARDLPAFYQRIVTAIRETDRVTPIMVEGGYFANPRNLAAWPEALPDARVLYAFHMYEPWVATSAPNMKREVPLRYPGVTTEYAGETLTWNRAKVAAHVATAFDWARANDLPPTRVVAGEFGCMRRWEDCGQYLDDVMDAVSGHGGHWAFYAFREDEWDGMDYELPASLAPGRFYWLSEQGKAASLPRSGELMQRIRKRMQD